MGKLSEAEIRALLSGEDLRSPGRANDLVARIHSAADFDTVFALLNDDDRLLVMRAADAIEKFTRSNNTYIQRHGSALATLATTAQNKELKWHLAQLASQLQPAGDEAAVFWEVFSSWALNPRESRIVRVMALQALYDILQKYPDFKPEFDAIADKLVQENIPSINARLRKLLKVSKKKASTSP